MTTLMTKVIKTMCRFRFLDVTSLLNELREVWFQYRTGGHDSMVSFKALE